MKLSRKRAAAVAGLAILSSCNNRHILCSAFQSPAFLTPTTNKYCNSSHGNQIRRPSLFARKQQTASSTSGTSSNRSASRSSTIIEEVKPLTSVSQEKRLSAIMALQRETRRGSGGRRSSSDIDSDPLFADMDAAAMLLDTFTQVTDQDIESDNNFRATEKPAQQKKSTKKKIAKPSNNRSVPGATSMSTFRRRAADEVGYSLSPRDTKDLYREDGSNQNRWAVDSLINKLDEKIRENNNDINMGYNENIGMYGDTVVEEKEQALPKKRGRGRPRKNPLPKEDGGTMVSSDNKVVKIKPAAVGKKAPVKKTSMKKARGSTAATHKSLTIVDSAKLPNIEDTQVSPARSKIKVNKGSANKRPGYAKPLIGASAINKQRRTTSSSATGSGGRRRVVKSLPKSRRDINGNIIQDASTSSQAVKSKVPGDGRIDSNRKPLSNDSLNLNRYYRTELLTAKEEYSLGMKVKFMVKCEAVHEGLSLQLDRLPTISEWASACGFTTYDAEISSENYIDNELDKQIRPYGSEDQDEIDPNMFVGNGLVNDSGVGRGKGRAKLPPPTKLGDVYDDSYDKFKRKENELPSPKKGEDDFDEYEEDGEDIFLYRQKMYPGEPINRGSPRIFREMVLTAKEAKQRMVQCNMRLVVSIARRYHGVGVNVQDLVQEGSLGLSRAAEKFDPTKGFKFSTYASWWIQQAVFRSIAYHSRTIRLPVHVHNLLNKVNRARRIMQQELGRMPSNEEMAEEMDMSIEKYNKMIRNTRKALSLERPKYANNPKDLGHESEALVGDMVDSSAVIFDEKTPEQTVDHGLLHNDIQYMIGKLGDDERRVLCLRYGIHDGITRTVTLVASEMRQTKSWVRSQECRALRKLRRPWYEKRLEEHRESLSAAHGKGSTSNKF